jgi:transposase InsO family protein
MAAHALKDWCEDAGTGTAFIDPGSPWQNPFVESFHSRVRDELLDVEEFSCPSTRQSGADQSSRHCTVETRPEQRPDLAVPAATARATTVVCNRVTHAARTQRDPDDRALIRLKPSDGLAPRLLAAGRAAM